MTGTIVSFTVIRVGGDSAQPYAVVLVDVGGERRSARMKGDGEGLEIGVSIELIEHDGRLTAVPLAPS